MGIKKLIPAPLLPLAYEGRERLRGMARKLRGHEMNREQFKAILVDFGVQPGATIMVHSSMGQVSRAVPGIKVTEVIEILMDLLGKQGTLLMPTFPFGGLQWDYVQQKPAFKPRRTPSKMGLLSEVFRRTPGVVRSLHPTHAIAAWGRHAESMTTDHHLGTAFGKTSPLYRLTEHQGRVIALGASPQSFTLLHVAEELHPRTHAYNYGKETFELDIITDEKTIPYSITPLRGDRKRNFARAVEILTSRGQLRHEFVKGLEMASADAREFLDGCLKIIDEGRFQDMD